MIWVLNTANEADEFVMFEKHCQSRGWSTQLSPVTAVMSTDVIMYVCHENEVHLHSDRQLTVKHTSVIRRTYLALMLTQRFSYKTRLCCIMGLLMLETVSLDVQHLVDLDGLWRKYRYKTKSYRFPIKKTKLTSYSYSLFNITEARFAESALCSLFVLHPSKHCVFLQ